MLQSGAFQGRNCNCSVAFANIPGVPVGREGRGSAKELRTFFLQEEERAMQTLTTSLKLQEKKSEQPGPGAETETLCEPCSPSGKTDEHQEQGVFNTLPEERATSLYHCSAV